MNTHGTPPGWRKKRRTVEYAPKCPEDGLYLLMASVIENALVDLEREPSRPEAEGWLTTDTGFFSATNCCKVLGITPERMIAGACRRVPDDIAERLRGRLFTGD